MLKFLILLLIVWVAFMVLGAVINALFWLIIIGAVLFVATAVYGWMRREELRH